MDQLFETLGRAAARAPSGDNTQPWRFAVDAVARRMTIHHDATRDPSPMNSGQRMSRMAVGAAVENACRTARSLGWQTDLEEARDGASVAIALAGFGSLQAELDAGIATRVTNRRRYDGRPLPAAVLAELQRQTEDIEGVSVHWIADRLQIGALARLIGRADALMLGERSMRRAFLDNIRFDAPTNAEVEEGLPLGSLELSAADRIGLRLLPYIPHRVLKTFGVLRKFATAARRLAESASGLCLMTVAEIAPRADLAAGRALQRAWLALTRHGLAAQPMMSLVILENALIHGRASLLASLGHETAKAAVEELRKLVPPIGDRHTAFLMRFGFAPPPTAVAGRLPLGANTVDTDVRTSDRAR